MTNNKIKILNLYAGIGGNRKHWDKLSPNIEVTAVELRENIAKVYKDYFPNDKVVVGDAHQYLEKHVQEFDIIWSSPPCPSHSIMRKNVCVGSGQSDPVFPNMTLYEEILFLQGYFDGVYVVENVKSWYNPLIEPQVEQRHYYWANFQLPSLSKDKDNISRGTIKEWEDLFGYDLSSYKFDSSYPKRKVLRNCVRPKHGYKILVEAIKKLNEIRGDSKHDE